ncbi:MAG: RNA polymerase sigma factor RpoD, partial [Caldimonas sp.]
MTAKKTVPNKAAAPTAKTARAASVDDTKKPAKAAAKAAPASAVAKGKGPLARGKGAVAKGIDKLPKPEAADVDLSEIEADLEGEPVVDATAKAKPLRMKVSRAKERA